MGMWWRCGHVNLYHYILYTPSPLHHYMHVSSINTKHTITITCPYLHHHTPHSLHHIPHSLHCTPHPSITPTLPPSYTAVHHFIVTVHTIPSHAHTSITCPHLHHMPTPPSHAHTSITCPHLYHMPTPPSHAHTSITCPHLHHMPTPPSHAHTTSITRPHPPVFLIGEC